MEEFAELTGKLQDPEAKYSDRLDAVRKLTEMGSPEAVEALAEATVHEERYVRMEAVRALGQIGLPEGAGPLISVLEGDDEALQRYAAEGLGEIGGREARDALRKAAEGASWTVQNAAEKALKQIGETTDSDDGGDYRELVATSTEWEHGPPPEPEQEPVVEAPENPWEKKEAEEKSAAEADRDRAENRAPAPEPAVLRQPSPVSVETPPPAAPPEVEPAAPAEPVIAPPRHAPAKAPPKPFRLIADSTRPAPRADLPLPPTIRVVTRSQRLPLLLTASTHVPAPPPEPNRVTIAADTLFTVRLDEDLSSEYSSAGDRFAATLDSPLIADGFVIAERGARAEGRVVEAQRAGRVKNTSVLALQLTRFQSSDGQEVDIVTDSFEKRPTRERVKDAAKVGAAASIGAVIGAIAGGGSGAAIGAAVGGAAGTGTVLATRGAPANLPAETRISFRLNTPVTLTEQLP